MKRAFAFIVVLGLALGGVVAAARARQQGVAVEPAELVLRSGKIVTVDEAVPQAQALAARAGRIVALGSNGDIQRYVGPTTEVIDLAGQLAIPGFIESHAHFTRIGEAELGLKLMKVKNWDEVVAMVAEAVKKAKPGEWIVGRGGTRKNGTSAPSRTLKASRRMNR